MKFKLLILFLLILTACQTPNPLAGRPVTLIKFQTSSGEKEVNVYLAQTQEEKAQGLMGVEQLPPNTGMLFVYDSPDNLGFWMKNMKIPLDFLYLDEAGVVVDLMENIPPCIEPYYCKEELELVPEECQCEIYRPQVPSQYVLEVPVGWIEEVGVEAGDQFQLD